LSAGAVAVYDLSGTSGWAVYSPDDDEPISGTLRLPPTRTDGSMGPTFQLLFNHIAWINRRWPLMALGYEAYLAPTGGHRDKGKGGDEEQKSFVTSQATLKKLIGTIAILEMCAEMLDIPAYSINNASWRRFWIGKMPRGTKREEWKRRSVLKARVLGIDVKGDDEADALGQLHHLLRELEIRSDWARAKMAHPTQDMIMLNYREGIALDV